jgi:hypothetical protein
MTLNLATHRADMRIGPLHMLRVLFIYSCERASHVSKQVYCTTGVERIYLQVG